MRVRWLNDGRRLIFLVEDQESLMLLDTETGAHREVLSVGPELFGGDFCLSRTNDFIYFPLVYRDADIWMLTLDEER